METRRVLFVLAALAAFPAVALGANIMLDEYGNAANDMGLIINSSIGKDIGPGGLPNALLYSVPVLTWLAGDFFMTEPPQGTETSDIIRFNANPYRSRRLILIEVFETEVRSARFFDNPFNDPVCGSIVAALEI